MPKLQVSWTEYHKKIEHLAVKIYQSGWQFNQILCLARGGLRVGDTLSRIYKQPLAILATSSYSSTGKQGKLVISSAITMTQATLGNRVLLVDDLADSGITLQKTLDWLKDHEEYDIESIKTAVIWCKAASIITPDFYVDFLPDNPWIQQPFEVYDRMNLEDLAQNSRT
jgi:uncharacterized protein